MGTMEGELGSVRAFSATGFSDPVFANRTMPAPLVEAGMSLEVWLALLDAADKAVVFHWNPKTVCCFFSFAHHTDIKPRMTKFVTELNGGRVAGATLPSRIVARYQMATEQHSVAASGSAGSGAATQTYHIIRFFHAAAAPTTMQMMDGKLPRVKN